MQWSAIDRTGTERAWGENWTYVVTQTETSVRLSRFGADRAILLTCAAEVMRNLIVFPLGRGPGRPGGEPELNALAEAAKSWAESFEAANGVLDWWADRPVSAEPWAPLRVTMAKQRYDRFELDDRTAAEEVVRYTGHIEDMPDETRLQLLGYLASAVLRRLPPAAGAADSCPNC